MWLSSCNMVGCEALIEEYFARELHTAVNTNSADVRALSRGHEDGCAEDACCSQLEESNPFTETVVTLSAAIQSNDGQVKNSLYSRQEAPPLQQQQQQHSPEEEQ